MTAAVQTAHTFELLEKCIKYLGAAVLPLWGVQDDGSCLCPKGKDCGKNSGKHPNPKLVPNGVKNATRDVAIVRQWLRTAPKSNWALRCGEPLPDGGFLGVLDTDPRNGSEETLVQIRHQHGDLPETVTDASGRGSGNHYFFRFKQSPASRNPGDGLDLQGADKYVLIPPSKHFTGGTYSWELGLAPGEIKVADAPRWLEEDTLEAVPRPVPDGGTARETVLGEAFALAGRAGPIMPENGMMMVNCPQSHLHSDNRGRGEDPSCVILPPAGGSRFGGFRCQHGHCANLKWQDVLKLLPQEAVDAANKKYPRLGVVAPKDDKDVDSKGNTAETAAKVRDVLDDCRKRMSWTSTKNGGSKLKNDELNLAVILTYDPRWKGIFAYDQFAQQLRFTREPPWHPDDKPHDRSLVWGDHHVSPLNLWLRRNWGLELPNDKIRDTVYTVARRHGCNPLTAYLDSLVWDGTKRIDTWLSFYLGVEDTPYARSVARKWLISAVARAYQPGAKVDTVLILEGPQGEGKSTALRVLATGRASDSGDQSSWFSDTAIPIGEKDAYVALRGKWIYELAELASLKKADLDKAKAFFSAPADSYRPPYGREQITVPRTCVFAGTVNLGEYLHDSTGARRFWPVKVGVIDIAALVEARDQLWAEAVAVYKNWVKRGMPQSECLWWPAPEERPDFEKEQGEREVTHPWTEQIAAWLRSKNAHNLVKAKGFLLTSEIASNALLIADKDLDIPNATRIGVIMVREMKWAKKRFTLNGARSWGFVPPEDY